jgi:predicted anti-sigma-YlaC factor YlaD
MSDHVIEWLNAYLDGELKSRRLHQVEEHLTHCEACQAELESLQGLSALLQEVPAPEFTSHERFVAQVNLLLPPRPVRATRSRVVEVGWWMIPIGLLAAWIFFSTAVLVSDMVSTVDRFGWLDTSAAMLVPDSSGNTIWTSALGWTGVLEGDSLQWAESTVDYTGNVLPQFFWQVSIALLYLAWIAIWWARRTHPARQPHDGLLEG